MRKQRKQCENILSDFLKRFSQISGRRPPLKLAAGHPIHWPQANTPPMTSSELNRKLLFRGHREVTDFLRNSPLNRCLYKRFLGIISASGITVPVVTLFNDIYYQCARVNYDGTPGIDTERRYFTEEERWIGSHEGAQLVFSAVWALLNLKRSITFQEECFLSELAPYIRNSDLRVFTEKLTQELLTSGVTVPERFPVMTCPVSEVVGAFSLTGKQYRTKEFFSADDPDYHNLLASWRTVWEEVTSGFSHSVIERYVRLYPDPDDQLQLIASIRASLFPKQHPERIQYLQELSQKIVTGSFDPVEGLSFQSVGVVEEGEGREGEPRLRFSLSADGGDDLDLVKRYRQERDALQGQIEEMRKRHAMELARMEAQYRAELEALRKENSKLIRWPSKKRAEEGLEKGNEKGLERRTEETGIGESVEEASEGAGSIVEAGAGELVFRLEEVAAHVKERFSKSGGEEVSTMLYHLAVEHGVLSEETFRLIDGIVPAILHRDLPQQNITVSNVNQLNNVIGTLNN